MRINKYKLKFMDAAPFDDELPNFIPSQSIPKISNVITKNANEIKIQKIEKAEDDKGINLHKEEKKPTEIGIIYEEISLLDSFHEEKISAKKEYDFPSLFEDKLPTPCCHSNIINIFNNIKIIPKTHHDLLSSNLNLLLKNLDNLQDIQDSKDHEKKKKIKNDPQKLKVNSAWLIKQKLEDHKQLKVYLLSSQKNKILKVQNMNKNLSQKSINSNKNLKQSINPKNSKNIENSLKNIEALIKRYKKNKSTKLPFISNKNRNSNISIKLLTAFHKFCLNKRTQDSDLISNKISSSTRDNLNMFSTFTRLDDDSNVNFQTTDIASHFTVSKKLNNNYIENENTLTK